MMRSTFICEKKNRKAKRIRLHVLRAGVFVFSIVSNVNWGEHVASPKCYISEELYEIHWLPFHSPLKSTRTQIQSTNVSLPHNHLSRISKHSSKRKPKPKQNENTKKYELISMVLTPATYYACRVCSVHTHTWSIAALSHVCVPFADCLLLVI